MAKRSLLVLALVSGCAADTGAASGRVFDPCGARVVLAPDTSPSERDAVDDGIALWNDASSIDAARAEQAESAIAIRFQPSLPAFFGRYDGDSGSILINRDIADPRARAIVVAHELGHAFGLAHVPLETEASLMNPANTTVPPTPRDVERLLALWGDCRSSASGD